MHGQVFDDVPRALKRWTGEEKEYSGSVLAQKLLFANTAAGDLTPYISRYFDTATGSKADSYSYQEIAKILQRLPSEIVFISDVTTELDAAKRAGTHTLLCLRPGNRLQPASTHRLIAPWMKCFPSDSGTKSFPDGSSLSDSE